MKSQHNPAREVSGLEKEERNYNPEELQDTASLYQQKLAECV